MTDIYATARGVGPTTLVSQSHRFLVGILDDSDVAYIWEGICRLTVPLRCLAYLSDERLDVVVDNYGEYLSGFRKRFQFRI